MPVTAIRDDDVDAVMDVAEIAPALPLLAEGHAVGADEPDDRRG